MDFTIDGQPMHYEVEGSTIWGDERVMLEDDENLISGLPWEEEGFLCTRFLSLEENQQVRAGFADIVRGMVEHAGAATDDTFSMDRYHLFVDDEQHCRVVGQIKDRIPIDRFPVPLSRVEERISEICERRLVMSGSEIGAQAFWLRIVRPQRRDANPLHRDVWLDRLRNKVNIYFPLAGSNENSSLCMVPGSHRWRESEIQRTGAGATINGVSFTVPAVVGAKHDIAAVRPNPSAEDVLVFSPYLVHGNATNLNPDRTRISLEIRFQRS